MLDLECPSFLAVFITDLQYGRKLGNWEPCHVKKEGWAKNRRGRPSSERTLIEFLLPGYLHSALTTHCWRSGGPSVGQSPTALSKWPKASSRWTIPATEGWRWGLSTFAVTVGTQISEVWFVFFLVNCAPWSSLVSSPSCLEDSLLVNRWASQEDLAQMTESDKRCFLFIKKKYKFIFPFQDGADRSSLQSSESRKARQNEPELKESQIFVHCIILSTPQLYKKANINHRGAREFKGGLCGLAALYWALTDTIYSPSQLTRSFTSHV